MWLGLCLSVWRSVLRALRRWWSECLEVARFPARPVAYAHGAPGVLLAAGRRRLLLEAPIPVSLLSYFISKLERLLLWSS